ncbi:hypothetical protein ACJ41O_014694 [Fusarium nematophilum]
MSDDAAQRPTALERDERPRIPGDRHRDEEMGESVPPGVDASPDRSGGEFGMSIFEEVVGRISPSPSINSYPPPDGGWRAWCVCFSSHLVYMNTWGWINSFGIFQAYYTGLLSRPASDISWIGSIAVFLLFFVGTITGRLVDAGYFRWVFATGILLQIVGVLVTSLCTEYWHFVVAQGVVVGLGSSCIFCPVLAVLSTYFARRRALAMGIAATGSATGGMIFPSLVRQLLPKVGFQWTLRISALTQLGTLGIAMILVKPRVIRGRRSGPWVDLSAFKDLEYTLYAIASFFTCWGVYNAYYFLAAFSQEALSPPFEYTEALDLLMILNGVGIIGRLPANYVADRVGAVNVFIPNCLAAAVLLFSWVAVRDRQGLYTWAVLYGVVGAAIQSLFPTGVSLLTRDLSRIGVRMGMAFTIVSFAALTGPPIVGAIVDAEGGYRGAQAFTGGVMFIGVGFLGAVKVRRMRRTGTGWMVKV